jgi:putative ABC transport system substrate-binding protein
VDHPGIDMVRQGFSDRMKELGYIQGKNIRYDQQSAQGQMPVAQSIAQKFVTDKVDLIYAITTPSSQAAAKATQGTKIPVIFGAVTDPVSAGLVRTLDKPGGNVTGTSDVWPVEDQFDLLLRLVPTVKRVGIVYNPGESNAQYNVKIAEEVCKKKGLQVVKVSVANTAEVQMATRSLVGRCDAIYAPADNTIISALSAVVGVAESNKIPLLVGDATSIEEGGFGTIGNDYFDIGRVSAELADRVLKGENPGDIPVARATSYEYFFNLKSAKKLGITIPDDLLKKAKKVYQ